NRVVAMGLHAARVDSPIRPSMGDHWVLRLLEQPVDRRDPHEGPAADLDGLKPAFADDRVHRSAPKTERLRRVVNRCCDDFHRSSPFINDREELAVPKKSREGRRFRKKPPETMG